jgi:hypothetical protein
MNSSIALSFMAAVVNAPRFRAVASRRKVWARCPASRKKSR